MKKLLTFLLTALLAFGVGWAETKQDFLDRSFTGVASGAGYSNWSDKAGTSGAVYAGNSAGGNNAIQLRGSSNSGIVTTASGGKVKSVKITFNTNTVTGRTVDIYGKNTPYSAATDLYNSNNQGTFIDEIYYDGSTTINTLTINGDYQYIGIRSKSNALYLASITIFWETGGSTVETCASPTFSPDGGIFTGSADVTITSATEGATIYYTTDGTDPVVSRSSIANGGTVTLTESCTLKAMAVKSGMENSPIVSSNSYTINSSSGSSSTIYRKVTSTDDLVPGQKYIIMYENGSSSVGMGAYDGSKHFNGVQNLTISNNQVNIANTSVLELTLGGTTGAWTLYTGSGYIQGAGAVQFNIVSNATDNNSKWVITNTVDNTNGFVVKNAQYDRYIKCYNSESFRHYGTSNGNWAYLYVQVNNNQPTLHAEPNPLNINDNNEADGKTGNIYVTGENLGSDNVGMTFDVNHSTNFSSNPGYFSHNGTVTDYPVAITYTGHALSATGIVYPANNVANTSVNINYLYTGPIYVIGDVNNYGWNPNYGAQMTRDENGVYSTTVSVQQSSDAGYISFTKQLGSNYADGQFGPVSSGNWWYNDGLNGTYQPIDTLGNVHNIRIEPGTYTIYVNPATNQFMIERYVITVTISPENGTTFTGPTISGTITDSPAGTIEWSSDGTNWQTYTDGFTLTANQVGDYVTVYARSTSNGVTSNPVSATYQRVLAPAPDAPVFSRPGGDVAAGTVVTITAPEGCTLYVDGQQVTNPYQVTINSACTISAYCVNDEGTSSQPVSYTFSISTVCEAEVVFKDNTNNQGEPADSSSPITASSIQDYYTTGADYISSVTGIDKVYKGITGLKFSSSSDPGTITFNLDNEFISWKVTQVILNVAKWKSSEGNATFTVTTNNNQTMSTPAVTSTDLSTYALNFDGSEISSITISATPRAYLKGFTIVYDCAPEIVAPAAPVITPATGTYFENQTVAITAEPGTTIYYTTNGTTPTTSSPQYTGEFTAAYTAGATTTIKAIAVDGQGIVSEETTVTYTWGTPAVTIHPDSRNTLATSINVTLTSDPAEGTIYYTIDGSTPSAENGTAYDGAFTVSIPNVGDAVTVKAVTVVNGITSPVATATYTHVNEVLDVHAPFFSPLQNNTYYGDQTLQIASTTPNADIYYEIVEVAGTTVPNASDVEDPTHMSTYYDGTPIQMIAGNSYYVKAIAYIGNYVSTISEGWYVIEPFTQTGYVYQNLKDFNDNCPTGVTASFANPVQVVYHSTYTNNGQYAEFCYVRDNTDYACIYFGKRDTHDYTIFKMGDWIDGSLIAGVTNIWDRNFHIQLGTGSHEVTSWPTAAIGWSEILPEEITNAVIVAGTAEGDNSWGHYVHLRNTTLRNVQDYSEGDPKHTGLINDGTADAYYYDKFYRWSAGTCSYTTGGNTYTDVINHLGDYDQAFFTAKQEAGATFDVYGIVDYYKPYEPPFEICPIDFLWIYKPVISLPTGTYTSEQQVSITAQDPEWAAEGVVIYYKTDDMEDWAIYDGPITVNSDTHIQTYAEVPAHTATINYNDYVHSVIVEATYNFEGVEDPIITPASQVIEVVDGTESVNVTVQTNPNSSTGAVTLYTIDGSDPRTSETAIVLTSENGTFTVTETTTVNAVSYLTDGDNTIWSNVVTETYEFIEDNGKTYNLLTANPKVGSIYVIVNKADKVGLSKTQNVTNRAATGVVFTDDATKTVVKGNTALEEFVLEAATAGRYYFRALNTSDYLVVTTNDNPNLMTGSEGTNAEATVTVNSGVTSGVDESYPATIAFSYDGTSRYLRYYAGGRTFTTYTAATTNQDVFLYGIEVPELLDPTIEPHSQVVQVTTGDESLTVTVTPNSENPAGAVTYYTTDGSDPRTSETRIEWNSENGEFPVNTTTTVKAVTGIEFGDGMVWSNVVSETYTFAGVEPPVIAPEGGLFGYGTTVDVTVTPSDQNPAGAVTYYTTDGSDPRTSETRIEWNSENGEFTVSENTTVKAATCMVVDDVTLWSVIVEQTYEFETGIVTTLAEIESTGVENKPYIVADELIGTWAVDNPVTGDKLLWAKDQGNLSIDKRPGKTDTQRDYVKDILKYEWQETWDESNWVILDFGGIEGDPFEFVGHKIKAGTVNGIYVNDENYRIQLTMKPGLTNGNPYSQDAPEYPGWVEPFPEDKLGTDYDLAYNSFVPANFMTENHNSRLENGEVVGGFVAPTTALYDHAGDSLYFINPKIQEVAHIWAVWNGGDEDIFTVYLTEHKENENINAWSLNGTFKVDWTYNCKSTDYDVNTNLEYGRPENLVPNMAYEFHAAIMRPNTSKRGDVEPQGTANPGTPSPDYMAYPLDMSDAGTPTAVIELNGLKTVVSISYYNLMGIESNKPFEGINIVVTRYSDGNISTVKILR